MPDFQVIEAKAPVRAVRLERPPHLSEGHSQAFVWQVDNGIKGDDAGEATGAKIERQHVAFAKVQSRIQPAGLRHHVG